MLWFSVLAVAARAEGPAFRPYEPPPPLASPGRATPASAECVDWSRIAPYELARQLAALDAWLRASGGLVLRPEVLQVCPDCGIGDTVAGPAGQRWLVVTGGDCVSDAIVAMNAQHEVFQVVLDPKPRWHHSLRECTPTWTGCGGGPHPISRT
ncbi:MAG: hypothetical protein R3F59_15870, partial [Myxococcota bacterium]